MTKQLVIILIALAALAAVAQTPRPAADKRKESISLKTGWPRPEFPLQIAGAVFNDTNLQLLLVNLTSREVEQATVGVLLEDETSPEPVTRIGKVCTTSIPPGRFLLVTNANTGFDAAVAYFRSKGITQKVVAVGITQVRLAGGIEWNLPLEAKGRFEGERDRDLEKKIEALRRKQFGRHDASIFFDPSLQRKVSTCRE